METQILNDVQSTTIGKVEIANAREGKLILYLQGKRKVSVRKMRFIAAKYGKSASFKLGLEPQVIFEDPCDELKPEIPTGLAAHQLWLGETPKGVVKLGPRCAGSTDVYVIRCEGQTLTETAADEWLKRPKSLDIHIGSSEVRLLVAQPSPSTLSISRLLRTGSLKISLPNCAGKKSKRRPLRTARREQL